MSQAKRPSLKFIVAAALIVASLGYIGYTGVQESKSFSVTIPELRGMGDQAYSRRLRLQGFVKPCSIKRSGTHASFVMQDGNEYIPVSYTGAEPPPDTFKDHAQALAMGEIGRDGVFHATELQAKCASKYQELEKASGPATQCT
jgi:cytochrome c-type biogenesis protein CcmE